MNSAAAAENDISALLKLFWAARIHILIGCLIFLPIGFLTMHVLAPTYTARAVIAPPEGQSKAGALSQLSGLSSALSSFTGDFSSSNNSSFSTLLESLGSHELSNELQRKDRILQIIYPNRWDPARDNWKPPGFLSRIVSTVKFIITGHTPRTIDTYALDDFLANHLSYDQIQGTPFYTVALTYRDRDHAEQFLSQALLSADSIVRDTHLARANDQIKYLERKLKEVTIEQHKQVLTELLLEQERAVMLAQSGSTYAFQFVRSVSSSPVPTSPKPLLVIGIFVILGILSGLVSYLWWIPLTSRLRHGKPPYPPLSH